MPDHKWQELYNAAILEFDLARLPERVEAACHAKFINTEYRSARASAQRNARSLTMLCECCSR